MKSILLLVFMSLMALDASSKTFTVHDGLTSSKSWMNGLGDVAECVKNNDAFLKEVGSFKKYDLTTKTPSQVEQMVRSSSLSIELTTYTPWNMFSKAISYRNTGSNVVYFNTRKNPRPIPEMVNTLIHEWLHVVGFDHGNNYAAGKENTVNYAVGSMAEKYVKGCMK